ncbi:hypothetical protein B9Z65_1682 [Elsinoe australis]|uniref:Uncharacterized protein n=1 Tax=Elsinoe australis TaxID=40998 RepID=A0A2P7YGK4_9PEZI|nr:hypothetical protein B9Z65_1682 [Elsinoe australis]
MEKQIEDTAAPKPSDEGSRSGFILPLLKYAFLLFTFLYLIAIVIDRTPLHSIMIQRPSRNDKVDDIDPPYTDDPYYQPASTYRSELGATAAIVCCWPSTGGLLRRGHVTGIELDFLGLDRFDNVPRPSPYNATLEDGFCERLERLGAAHHKDDSDCFESMLHGTRRYRALLAWPENDAGGAWALVLTR